MTAALQSTLLRHLDEAEYARFHELAQALTGMVFNDHRRPELERAVAETLQATGLTDLASLYDVLEQAPASHPARIRFVRHLAVGETHFFRNEPQFSALAQHILPDLIERKRGVRQLRIWSAGCSTGEEPYSLAILLERLLPDLADWNVLLLATDINQDALERAQQGVYGPWSFRQAPPAFQAAYFTQEGRTFTLLPRIRQRVTFAYLNLAGANYPSPLTNTTHMDLILCRNVLIYFPPATTQHVVHRLYDALAEDGWLIVGHAEPSQEVFHRFVSCNFPDTVVYRKQPLALVSPASFPPTLWPALANLPASRPVAPPPRMPAPASAPPQSALRLPAPPPIHPLVTPAQLNVDARYADARYAGALALAAAGEYDQASQQLAALASPPFISHNCWPAAANLPRPSGGCKSPWSGRRCWPKRTISTVCCSPKPGSRMPR